MAPQLHDPALRPFNLPEPDAGELRFRNMAEAAPLMIWRTGPDKACTWVNQRWIEFTGATMAATLGQGWVDSLHPDDRSQSFGIFSNACDRREDFQMDYRLRRHDDEYRWIRAQGSPLYSRSGHYNGFVGSCTDIHDRMRVEETLRSTLDSLRANVAILDRGGVILRVNFGWVAFGRAEGAKADVSKGVGLNYLDVCRSAAGVDDIDRILAGLIAVLQGDLREFQAIYPCHAPTQRRWFELQAVPHRWQNGGLVVSHVDISERVALDERLQQQRRDFSRVGRIAAMGELAGAMAHELNQPLAAIQSNAQAAQRFLANPSPDLPEVRSGLADIVNDCRRASGVIRGLRSLLEKGEHGQAAVDVNELVAETEPLLRSQALGLGISLRLRLRAQNPRTRGDRIQLQQVLMNLVLNGFEAIGSNGNQHLKEVTVETSNPDTGGIRVAVRDTGAGIDAQAKRMMFEAFFTTKAEGMGMGLAICRRIIRAHGGRIAAKENAGPGLTVQFTLPSVDDHD